MYAKAHIPPLFSYLVNDFLVTEEEFYVVHQ
jgi:hypothetical protein